MVAYGSDLDQVRSRSALANSAALLCAVLQYPHDTILRALPTSLLVELPQVAGAVVLLNSLVWGVALSVVWQSLLATRKAINECKSAVSGMS
jgi:hypothetical protein